MDRIGVLRKNYNSCLRGWKVCKRFRLELSWQRANVKFTPEWPWIWGREAWQERRKCLLGCDMKISFEIEYEKSDARVRRLCDSCCN